MMPTVSIVTICYNAAQMIEDTLKSVLSQTFTDYEYVFIDGNSKDSTVACIESYRAAFEAKGISYRVTSEPDKGIYDAMNKGVAKAQGQWILMLNAGDRFVDNDVLWDLFTDRQYEADIIYGDTVNSDIIRNTTYYKIAPAQPLDGLLQGIPFCHQSVFVRNEILKKYQFDTAFRICADYDMFLRAYLDGVKFCYVRRLVCVYDCSGVTLENPKAARKESVMVRQKACIDSDGKRIRNLKGQLRTSLRKFLKYNLPGILFSEKNGWYRQMPSNSSWVASAE